jgi:hypothetical protein
MGRVTRVDDIGAEVATIELDDLTVKILCSRIPENLEGASTEARRSQEFELSREELARDYRRLSIDWSHRFTDSDT